ncbi:MAG: hypothetical protein DCC67_05030 [Planctomycetota bacterium]|nr:MAG: hypothetical protein DCC67_05030 [Planctomycetota bacterium]
MSKTMQYGAISFDAYGKAHSSLRPAQLLLAACCVLACQPRPSVADDAGVSLAGQWRLQLDRDDVGLKEGWFNQQLLDEIKLPGNLSEQGVGDDITTKTPWMGDVKQHQWFKDPLYAEHAKPGDIHFPFWLQPNKYYAGVAWYQREIEIPKDWQGKRVVLTLERPHWETRVWIDGEAIGANDSLSTPHVYDLGASLTPGKHRLAVRVDNRLVVDIGVNSHSITDHTQGNWNGIVGRLELAAISPVWIEDLQVHPSAPAKRARVQVKLANALGKATSGELKLTIEPRNGATALKLAPVVRQVEIPIDGASAEIDVVFGDEASPWDEFSPALYAVRAELTAGDERRWRDEQQATFGLRDVSTAGTQFLINGRKTFFRGTLECAVFPATGHPPTDVDSWRRIIRICKAHGLNMIRFHSWCPPEAAFTAADELGFYYQVEAASWANHPTKLGDGERVDEWIMRETDRILKAYGNHPSFVLMAYGNEPGGPNQESYLAKWVTRYRQLDPRRLYTSGSGWPQIAENQFHVTPDPRIQQWGEGVKSRINGKPPETTTDYRDYIQARDVPVISHEIGQWCVYPNFEEIAKYVGYLKPKNFEIFRDSLADHGMGDQARDFLIASGKLQTLCYKEDIESSLRTPGMGGFQLLGLNDFPGQGTALVGLLDPFWDEKGYVTAKEFRRFCAETVPMARLRKRVFTSDENLEAIVEIAHFGPAPLENAVVRWRLVDEGGAAVAEGKLPPQTIPVDNGNQLGEVSIPLNGCSTPARYKLVVAIAETPFENDWDVWIYPANLAPDSPADVLLTDELSDDVLAKLNAGGKVLLAIPPHRVRGDDRGKVGLGFSSIFWNTAWTDRQLPHTLGILCDPKHPLFAAFPTESHSNWQWSYLIRHAGAMILKDLPVELRPVVQVIDDWVTNRRLGLVFEAKLGPGKLMVCSIDLENGLEADPVRRQFRHSLLKYMGSSQFAPAHSVTADQVRKLFAEPSPMERLGVVSVTADSEEAANEGYLAFDGNPKTFWHTEWRANGPGLPHSLQVEFRKPITIRGFTALPRQDGVRHGWINDYLLYASDDGKNWGEPVARGSFTADKQLKAVEFKPVTARFFRLVAASGFDALPYASLAEFCVLPVNEDKEDSQRDGDRKDDVRASRRNRQTMPAQLGSAVPTDDVHRITLDGRDSGLRFDGVGGVSAGGSSRLLFDYPEPQQSEILDYLFKPNYGAALQILKVEIGSDADATAGAEPSHMRKPDEVNGNRGYQWRLMEQAKARNPNIKLYALAWSAPGWLEGGFWSDDNIHYTLAWLDCARQRGLTIDYLGGGNERGWDAKYYVKLAKALDEHGYGHIKIVASDDHAPPNYWQVADEMKRNPRFDAAVDVVGQHDVCVWRSQQRRCFVSETAASLGKPLWDSENSTQDYQVGAWPLARAMNRHYIDGRVTGNLNWALVGAYYGSFPAAGTGLILADRPWSGYYDVSPIVWVNAHTTQFVQPGWQYLDRSCGYTRGDASYVALRSPNTGDYALVIETLDLSGPETLAVAVSGGLSTGEVQLWSTDLATDDDADDFVHLGAIQPRDGLYRVAIEPGRVYTLATTQGQRKGEAQPSAVRSERLALPYREDFDDLQPGQLAPYLADVHGGFEVASCGGGRPGLCYRQAVEQEPILWHGANMPPTTILGDPQWWGDYEVGVDVLLEQPGYVELLARVESQQHNVAGYHLQLRDTGAWRLYSEDSARTQRTLATGAAGEFGVNRWRRLSLRFLGDQITATLDGVQLASVRDDGHSCGQVGVRCSPWQNAQFDNLEIAATAPVPRFVPRSEMSATASSEHAENHFGSVFTAAKAIDDRVETSWRPELGRIATAPQWITLDLRRERDLCGLCYKPPVARAKDSAIADWRILISRDNEAFEEVARGAWAANEAVKIVRWPAQRGRYVRLEATGRGGWPADGVMVSELDVIVAAEDEAAVIAAQRS